MFAFLRLCIGLFGFFADWSETSTNRTTQPSMSIKTVTSLLKLEALAAWMEPSDGSVSMFQWSPLNYVALTASLLTLSHRGSVQEALVGDVLDL